MKQQYDQYTHEDQAVWRTLFSRQVDNLQDKACKEFLACLHELESVLNEYAIPDFNAVNRVLPEHVG